MLERLLNILEDSMENMLLLMLKIIRIEENLKERELKERIKYIIIL